MPVKFKISFATHPRAQLWSIRNTIKPEEVGLKSHKEAWFVCDICNHEFISVISNISRGQWCPYCSIPCRKLCNDIECKRCFNNSFASYDKSQFWDDSNIEKPRDIIKYSHTSYTFNCDCGHKFESQIQNIVQGRWCPYCSIPCKKICNDMYCQQCINNSFEGVILDTIQCNFVRRNYIKNSTEKESFTCKSCEYTFKSTIHSITQGSRCPLCRNKTEKKLLNWLYQSFTVKYQTKYDWCKNPITNKYLPYDFEILNNIIIELDGKQHFEQISNWRAPDEQFRLDIYKMKCAIKNNMHIIRICQEDVWKDTYDWKTLLHQTINELLIITEPTIKLIDFSTKNYSDKYLIYNINDSEIDLNES